MPSKGNIIKATDLNAQTVGAVPIEDSVTTATPNKLLRLNGSSQLPASITGNAATATKLLTARTISLAGDATGSVSFDGTGNVSITVAYKNSGVTAGTYRSVTVDVKGNITAGTNPTTLSGYAITDAVNVSELVTVATANKVLKLDASGNLPTSITGNASGNAGTATKLQTARTISLTGDVTGSVSFDGSGNASITAAYKNSGVTAGTYRSVTVDAKGNVTAGTNPTTLSGYGITDALLSSEVVTSATANKVLRLNASGVLPASITGDAATVAGRSVNDGSTATTSLWTASKVNSELNKMVQTSTATLPATAGWYRIAQSPADIGRCSARFEVDWAISGNHGQVIFNAAIMYGQSLAMSQTLYSNYGASSGLTRARVVYHTTYAGNYAYLEVYNNTASAISLTVQSLNPMGWSLTPPSTVGSIPSGYTNRELIFIDGISTEGQFKSSVSQGTSPFVVVSDTMVPNLNADKLDGLHASSFGQNFNMATGVDVNTLVDSGFYRLGNTPVNGAGAAAYGQVITSHGAGDTIFQILGNYRNSEFYMRSGNPAQIGGLGTFDPWRKLWHDGNHGLGSGLDADMLDGYQASTTAVANRVPVYNASAQLVGNITGNSATSTKLATARTISLTGNATGSVSFDGSGNAAITVSVTDNSHAHTIANVTGLQTALDGKSATNHTHTIAGASITDVIITSPANGQVMRYNGSAWINNTLAEAGIAPAVHSHDYQQHKVTNDINAISAATDWNNYDSTGFYMGSSMANAITGVGVWRYMTSIRHNATYSSQTMMDFDGTAMGFRGKNAGTWGAWNMLWHNNNFNPASKLDATANAVSATKLQTARTISLTGDVTGSVSFDGTGNASIAATYKNSGVTAGTYKSVTVDSKGNVTAGTNPTTLGGYGITDAFSKTGGTLTGNVTIETAAGSELILKQTNSAVSAANVLSFEKAGMSGSTYVGFDGSASQRLLIYSSGASIALIPKSGGNVAVYSNLVVSQAASTSIEIESTNASTTSELTLTSPGGYWGIQHRSASQNDLAFSYGGATQLTLSKVGTLHAKANQYAGNVATSILERGAINMHNSDILGGRAFVMDSVINPTEQKGFYFKTSDHGTDVAEDFNLNNNVAFDRIYARNGAMMFNNRAITDGHAPNSVADHIIYVSGTGNDSTARWNSTTYKFKTIQAAINSIPQVHVANYEIRCAAGTYAEEVRVYGYSGGDIVIGYDGTAPDSQAGATGLNLLSIDFGNCQCYFRFSDFDFYNSDTLTMAGNACIHARRVAYLAVVNCRFDSTTKTNSTICVKLEASTGSVSLCFFSNQYLMLRAQYGATGIWNNSNTSSGTNTFALSSFMSTVFKLGAIGVTATSLESKTGGGQIY